MLQTMTTHRTDHRIDALKAMLSTYQEARSVSSGAGGSGGRAESRYLEFDPSTWTREYQELERVLEHLKWLAGHGRPILKGTGVSSSRGWWNIRMRYLHCEKVRRMIHTRKTSSGVRVPTGIRPNEELAASATILNGSQASVMVWRWDQRVDLEVVDKTIGWISGEFRGHPSIYRQED